MIDLSGNRFTVTNDHLKLMRRFYVGWQYCETGAPEIDPKRPYGNSDVIGDIHEILTGKEWDSDNDMPEKLIKKYEKLHKETAMALQIALATGQFKAATYETSASYLRDWKEVNEMVMYP